MYNYSSIRIRVQIVRLLIAGNHVDILPLDIIQHIFGELTCRHARMVPGELAEILRVFLILKNISVAGINLIDHESYFSRRASLQFRLTENT